MAIELPENNFIKKITNKNKSLQSYKNFNTAMAIIANDIFIYGKILPVHQIWLTEDSYVELSHRLEMSRIAEYLLKHKKEFSSDTNTQASQNFDTFFRFVRTKIGNIFIRNLSDLNPPEYIEWYDLFRYLEKDYNNFEAELLPSYVKKVENMKAQFDQQNIQLK